MGLVCFIIARVLGFVLMPAGVIFGMVQSLRKYQLGPALKTADAKLFAMAVAYDIYGNIVLAELFTRVFLTGDTSHPFGLQGETISKVLGHNQWNKTLTRRGLWLVRKLDAIDPGHCLRAAGYLPK